MKTHVSERSKLQVRNTLAKRITLHFCSSQVGICTEIKQLYVSEHMIKSEKFKKIPINSALVIQI